jgi:hypothetical protein
MPTSGSSREHIELLAAVEALGAAQHPCAHQKEQPKNTRPHTSQASHINQEAPTTRPMLNDERKREAAARNDEEAVL